MNFMEDSSMKCNLAVFCCGLLLGFNVYTSSSRDLEQSENVNVFLMQGNKLLLQAKSDNQWSTLSAYCGEGGSAHNQAIGLLKESQIAVAKIYSVPHIPFEDIQSYQHIFAAQVGSEVQLGVAYKNIKNKYLFFKNGWQSFDEVDFPDSYTNHKYLNKDLVATVLAAYKAGNCVPVSKEYESMPWEN